MRPRLARELTDAGVPADASGPVESGDRWQVWPSGRAADGVVLLCALCMGVTPNPGDVAHRYCPRCHVFLNDPASMPAPPAGAT